LRLIKGFQNACAFFALTKGRRLGYNDACQHDCSGVVQRQDESFWSSLLGFESLPRSLFCGKAREISTPIVSQDNINGYRKDTLVPKQNKSRELFLPFYCLFL